MANVTVADMPIILTSIIIEGCIQVLNVNTEPVNRHNHCVNESMFLKNSELGRQKK